MGALLGLVLGLGMLLIWSAFALPTDRTRRAVHRSRLRMRLDRAGMAQTHTSSVWTLAVVLGLVAGVVVLGVTGTPPVAVVFAVLAGWAPFGLIGSRARSRQREFAQLWPDAVDNLASGVRAGMSLPEALAALGSTGPEALREPFAAFALDYQLTGRFTDCLERLKERLADPVGDRVVEGLRVAREVGGGELGRLLRSLSRFLRDDLHTRSEMESRQAWVVNGARLAVAAPWAVLLVMSISGSSIQRYSTPAGVVVLSCGAIACIGAYRLMVRIGRLPTERRVLA